MEKSEKIENSDVKEYIFDLALEKLGKNSTFVKVYGEDFIRKRLKVNLLVVYTNEPKDINGKAGYYDPDTKSIVICCEFNNSELITPEILEKDLDMQETALHEAIHAILTFLEKECKEYGIFWGTGCLKCAANEEFYIELGRGFNEGWTEWLCEKCGYFVLAYPELTDLVRLVEVALGTENVMELGKGNFEDRFQEIFFMIQSEVDTFLAYADTIYYTNARIRYDNKIVNYLEGLIHNYKDFIVNEEFEQSIEKYRKDPVFLAYIKENKKDASSNEALLEYLNEIQIPNTTQRKQSAIIMAESTLINRYFINDFQKGFSGENISKEDFDKVRKIFSLLNTDLDNISECFKNTTPEMSSITIKREYKNFIERYIKQVVKEEVEKYQKGELNLPDFIEKGKNLAGKEFSSCEKDMYCDIFSKSIVNDDELSKCLSILIYNVWSSTEYPDNYSDRLTKFSIFKLVSENDEPKLSSTVVFDKKNDSNNFYWDCFYTDCCSINSSEDKVEFSFTADMEVDDEYELTIKNFMNLREKIFEENINAKISIAGREIMVQNGDELDFYKIYKGQFIPMKVVKQLDLNFSPKYKEEKNIETKKQLLIPKKNNFFVMIKNKLKKFFENKKNKELINIDKPIVYNSSEENKIDSYIVDNFDERLKENKENLNLGLDNKNKNENEYEYQK